MSEELMAEPEAGLEDIYQVLTQIRDQLRDITDLLAAAQKGMLWEPPRRQT